MWLEVRWWWFGLMTWYKTALGNRACITSFKEWGGMLLAPNVTSWWQTIEEQVKETVKRHEGWSWMFPWPVVECASVGMLVPIVQSGCSQGLAGDPCRRHMTTFESPSSPTVPCSLAVSFLGEWDVCPRCHLGMDGWMDGKSTGI